MPDHYKQYKTGTPEHKKAYAQHLMQKLKKKRKAQTNYPSVPIGSPTVPMGGGESN